MDRRPLVVPALIAFIVVVPRLAGLYTTHLFDDAFITFRYSENLARGHGLVYNLDVRTLGTTAPLFALLLAGLRRFGLPVPVASVLIGVASDVASGLLIYRLMRREAGVLPAVLAVLVFAVDPHVIRVGVGGMESSLFLALSLLLIDLLLQGRAVASFPLASASLYVRPEGVLLWLASLVLLARARERARLRAVSLALGLAIMLLPLALMQVYYGSAAPQSVLSKGHKVGGSLWDVVTVFFFPPGSPAQTVLTVLAVPGVVIAWRRSRLGRVLVVWLGTYVLAYLAARPHMWTWYALPVYCGKAVFAGVALAQLLRRALPESPRLEARALGAAAALAVLAAVGMAMVAGASPVRRHVYQPLQAWCGTNLRGGETIAAGDIGALGYYCDAFIYDLAGLVWGERWQFADHLQVVDAKKPDYIFAETASYWSSLFDPGSPLRRRYRPVQRFSPSGHTEVSVPSTELTPGWKLDYVLFERVDRGRSATVVVP
jgi:hypothetical protein